MSNTNEVPALLAALVEHKNFRQLAIYGIECLNKVIDPATNRDWKKNLSVAYSCGASKIVVDVLKRHPGKEDILLVCCECLKKLSADPSNAEVIANEGGAEVLLGILKNSEHLSDHFRQLILSILESLADHTKSQNILANKGTIVPLTAVINVPNQLEELNIGCVKAIAKLAKVQKAQDDFVGANGIPSLINTLNTLSLEPTEEESPKFVAVSLGTKLLLRLLTYDPKNIDVMKVNGGIEYCLQLMDFSQELSLNRTTSKLISLLTGGSDSISNILESLKNLNLLSTTAQERLFGLLSSLSMDSNSCTGIVRNGGVKILIQACESKASARQLEVTTKTILRLASGNAECILSLVSSGAIPTLVKILMSDFSADNAASISAKINSVMALSKICLNTENFDMVVNEGGLSAVLNLLCLQRMPTSLIASIFSLLESLCGRNGLIDGHVSFDHITAIVMLMVQFVNNQKLVTSGLKILIDLAISEEVLQLLLQCGCIELIISILKQHVFQAKLLKDAITLLSLLLLIPDSVENYIINSQDNQALDAIVLAVSSNFKIELLRGVARDLIIQLSSDYLIAKIISDISELSSRISDGDRTSPTLEKIPNVALTISTFSIVTDNLIRIANLGGISPLILLLKVVSCLSNSSTSQINALSALFMSLEEVLSSSNLDLPNLVDLIQCCVSSLQKYSSVAPIVTSALKFLRTISSSSLNHVACVENEVFDALSSISKLYAENCDTFKLVLDIYKNFCSGDEEMLSLICSHNVSKTLLFCVDKNLNDNESSAISILSLVFCLLRISTIPVGCDTLRRQDCACYIFNILEVFKSNDKVYDAARQLLKAIITERDIKSIINSLSKKIKNPEFFTINDTSTDLIDKGTLDVKKLNAVLTCGVGIVGAITSLGGNAVLQNCLAGFGKFADATDFDSLNRRSRTAFIDACIQAIGQLSMEIDDLESALAMIPLIVRSLALTPSVVILEIISNMMTFHRRLLEELEKAGIASKIIDICKSELYTGDITKAAFKCLAKLCLSRSALTIIVQNNCAHLICNFILDSLLNEQISNSNVELLRAGISVLLELAKAGSNISLDKTLLDTIMEIIEALYMLSENSGDSFFPDILSDSLVVISALLKIEANKFCFIENNAIVKLLNLLQLNSDGYFKLRDPTIAFASMICVLGNLGEAYIEYLSSLNLVETLLRVMGLHSLDSEVQKTISQAIGLLGYADATTGLASFLEQLIELLAQLEEELQHHLIPQLSQYLQLINNILLIEQSIDETLLHELFTSFYRAIKILFRPIQGSTTERDESLLSSILALSHLLSFGLQFFDAQSLLATVSLLIEIIASLSITHGELKLACIRFLHKFVIIKGIGSSAEDGILYMISTEGFNKLNQSLDTFKFRKNMDCYDVIIVELSNLIEAICQQVGEHTSELLNLNDLGLSISTDILFCGVCQDLSKSCSWDKFILSISVNPNLGIFYILSLLANVTNSSYKKHPSYNAVLSQLLSILLESAAAGHYGFIEDSYQIGGIVRAIETICDQKFIELIGVLANGPFSCEILLCNPKLVSLVIDNIITVDLSVKCSEISSRIISYNLPNTIELMLSLNIVPVSINTLRQLSNVEVCQNILYCLRSMVDIKGFDNVHLPKETIALLQQIVKKYPQNTFIIEHATYLCDSLNAIYAIGPEAQLEQTLNDILNAAKILGGWVQIVEQNERVQTIYFYNVKTGETQWEATPNYEVFSSHIKLMSSLLATLNFDLSNVSLNDNVSTSILKLNVLFDKDIMVLQSLNLFAFATVVNMKQREKQLVLSDLEDAALLTGLQCLLKNDFLLSESDLEKALQIVEKLSQQEKSLSKLSVEKFIEVLCNTCKKYLNRENVLTSALGTLSAIIKSNKNTIPIAFKFDIHIILSNSVKRHLPTYVNIVDASLPNEGNIFMMIGTTLNSIVSCNNEIITNNLCSTCMVDIIDILNTFNLNVAYVLRIIRVLGSVSLHNPSIIFMLKCGSVKAIARLINTHINKGQLVRFSLELFGNLGSLEAADLQTSELNVNKIFIDEGGLTSILKAIKSNEDKPDVIMAGMGSLLNIIDEEISTILFSQGLCNLCFSLLSRYEYDSKLVISILKVLVVLASFNAEEICGVNNGDRLITLLQIIEASSNSINALDLDVVEVVSQILQVLCSIFALDFNRSKMKEIGLSTLLSVLSIFESSDDVLGYTISTFSRLAASEDISIVVAEKSCHDLLLLASKSYERSNLISKIFELMGQLAFIKVNLKGIIQHGGVRIILDVIEKLPEDEELMISAISTIDNIVATDEEYANYVIEKGGIEAVEKIQTLYSSNRAVHAELLQIIKSALLSMNAMSRLKAQEGSKTNITTLFTRLADVVDVKAAVTQKEVKYTVQKGPVVDPLTTAHRNLLKAGQMISDFVKGQGNPRHMYVTPDGSSLVIQERSNKIIKATRTIPVGSFRSATKGHGPGHFYKTLFGGKKSNAAEEKSLYIAATNADDEVTIEFANAHDREKWFDTINALITAVHTCPEVLRPL